MSPFVVAFSVARDHVEAEAFECCEVEFCLFGRRFPGEIGGGSQAVRIGCA